MENSCTIKFSSNIDGQAYMFTAFGNIIDSEGGVVISFQEVIDENLINSKITILNNSKVMIVRTGIYSSNFEFEQNKQSVSIYKSPYGDIDNLLHCSHLSVRRRGGLINIKAIYSIISNSFDNVNSLDINIKINR